jgi:MFS family permease
MIMRKPVLVLIAICSVVYFFFAGRIGQRAIVLTSLVGFGLAQSGTALADGPTSLFLWRLVTGVLIDRLGAFPTLIAFLSISTVLLLILGQVLASASAPVLWVLLAVCGFFVLGAYGGVNVVLASFYPAPLRAAGIGWTKSVGRLGTLVAPVLIGVGLSAGMADTAIMSMFAVPALLAVLSLVVLAVCKTRARAEA